MKRLLLLFCIACLSLGTFAHSVVLIPNTGCQKVVPLSGVTKVSGGIFGLAVKAGAHDRIVDYDKCKLKNCMVFSCDFELSRGKIVNVTNELIVVHATYYYEDGRYKEEDIEVLPRTFSRLMGGEYVRKIVCSFDY